MRRDRLGTTCPDMAWEPKESFRAAARCCSAQEQRQIEQGVDVRGSGRRSTARTTEDENR